MNATDRRIYWNGYRYMKQLSIELWSVPKAYSEIYNSNAGDLFVKGAQRARAYLERVGIRNARG